MDLLNLTSLFGLFVMVMLAWLFSSHKSKVNWRLVVVGIVFQAALAALFFQSQSWTFNRQFDSFPDVLAAIESEEISKASAIEFFDGAELPSGSFEQLQQALETDSLDETQLRDELVNNDLTISIPRFDKGILFYAVNSVFASINAYVAEGSEFVFKAYPTSGTWNDTTVLLRTFAFGVLPTVIFFASLMAVLYHIGVMQWLVRSMAWVMQKTLGTSGPESMAAAANVLVGHTEAPLVIRPYVANMTRSELNALMVGGFATISGSLMAIFVANGISAGHLLTASLISAPAALVIAKVLQPETETPGQLDEAVIDEANRPTNVIEAAAIGASDGLKLALNITAMLIAFLALLALINALIMGLGEAIQFLINLFVVDPVDVDWSLNRLFALLFAPLAWVMGIQSSDCALAGELLGKKVVVNEFIAYLDLSAIVNGEVTDADGNVVQLSERTVVILTYALCGFSNFGAIGIQIGGIGPLAPERRSDLAQLGLRAMFGGMLAACMTACMAGIMYMN
ncbi:MAG: nucleoside transporter C-terminal domain-containing protein [Planctomycetota bacterium]